MKRKPVHTAVALALTLLSPGLGNFYGGFFRRGLLFFALGQIILSAYLRLPWAIPGNGTAAFLLFTAALIAWYLSAARDVWRTVFDRGRGKRFWAAFAGSVFACFFVILVIVAVIDSFYYEQPSASYIIPHGNASMEPALLEGTRLLADHTAYMNRAPVPGEVITFHLPENTYIYYIRRVVSCGEDANPGDEAYRVLFDVTEGRAFVCFAADNPDASPRPGVNAVPLTSVLGRADVIYWPPSRWGRIPDAPQTPESY